MADQTPITTPKILVVTKATFFDIDKLGSTIVLAKLLANKYDTTVDIFCRPEIPKQSLTKLATPTRVTFIDKLDPDYFTITIDRGNAKVKEIRWEETKDQIKLLVFTEKGELDSTNYAMLPGVPQYDYLVTLGIKTEEDIKDQLGSFSGLWDAAETINIDLRGENSKYAQSNFVYPDAKSYAEAVIHYAADQEIEIKNDEATELLGFVYWKTNSLRNKYTTADTFTLVHNLLNKGANLTSAVNQIFGSISLLEVKARQEAFNSLVLDSDRVAIAKVSKDTGYQLAKTHAITPEKNPIFGLKDAAVSFTIVPLEQEKTLVLASSRDERFNLKKLFGEYSFVGDNLQAELTFNLGPDATTTKIKDILSRKIFNRPVESTSAPTVKDITKPELPATETKPVQESPKPESAPAVEKEPEVKTPELTTADPLQPAAEMIEPAPATSGDNLAPAATNAFPTFGGLDSMGGTGNNKDPLPPAPKN